MRRYVTMLVPVSHQTDHACIQGREIGVTVNKIHYLKGVIELMNWSSLLQVFYTWLVTCWAAEMSVLHFHRIKLVDISSSWNGNDITLRLVYKCPTWCSVYI